MESTAAIHESASWAAALEGVGLSDGAPAPAPDLALLFTTPGYTESEKLVAEAYRRSAASVLIGCTGGGVIGKDREIEGQRAVSLLCLSLPGTELAPRHLLASDLVDLRTAEDWRQWAKIPRSGVNAWIVLTDPFSIDPQEIIDGLAAAFPEATIAGGLASSLGGRDDTMVFLNGSSFSEGAVLLALSGAYTVQSVVAQGATPIGQPWTITGVERNVLRTIGNRPPLDVLRETLDGLSEEMRERAARNLLVGLAINEYRDQFGPGDFLIRNLMGVDRESGAMAIGAMPSVGQTIQFQIRDAAAADQDLRRQLAAARTRLGGSEVAGGLLCTCNGRGVGLFGAPDHDARTISEMLGSLPLAGFFCNGEIGPVGGETYVHGFTASLALFVPAEPRP